MRVRRAQKRKEDERDNDEKIDVGDMEARRGVWQEVAAQDIRELLGADDHQIIERDEERRLQAVAATKKQTDPSR